MNRFDAERWPEASPERLLLELAGAAIDSSLPANCIPRAVNQIFTAPPKGRTLVVGAGKAAAQMAAAFEAVYPWPVEGLVVTRFGFGCPTAAIRVIEASHPAPDETSALAGTALLEAMAGAQANDRVVFLLSGGCSSLIFTPTPELDHSEVQQFVSSLLASGLPVDAMNRIRQALSLTGGGRLAMACPGELTTLAISDVVGDRPEDIGSAPTSKPSPVAQEELETAKRHLETFSPDIRAFLQRSQSCKHARIDAAAANFHVIASSRQALERAERLAERRRIGRLVCEPDVAGDVQAVAAQHARQAAAASRAGGPVLFLSGGELTVTISPEASATAKGGPNQEYAMRVCRALHEEGVMATILSIDTDGVDGRGDAAGGLISTDTYRRVFTQELEVENLLARNESYRLLETADALLKPGPTGTNVNDFRAVLISGMSRNPQPQDH